jgi:hypothetical protein
VLYEGRILEVAKTMGIFRQDKQACLCWGEVLKWAIRDDNHWSAAIQWETMRKLIELFHCRLDSIGNDFWLGRSVAN